MTDAKISSLKLTGILIGASLLTTTLGIIRKVDGTLSSALTMNINNRYYPESFSPITKELAASVLTISTALDNIPSKIDHTYGLFMLQNFSVLIPGLNSFINSQFDIDYNYFSSAKLLTYLSLGPNAGWGVGTSAIADVYLDFGLIGIIGGFLLFGYLMKCLEVHVLAYKSRRFFQVATYLLYFSFCFYIARSNLVVPFTKLAYVAFFYYMIVFFDNNKHRYEKRC